MGAIKDDMQKAKNGGTGNILRSVPFTDKEVRLIWEEIRNRRGWKRRQFFDKFKEANADTLPKTWNYKRLERFLVLCPRKRKREPVPPEWRVRMARAFGWTLDQFEQYLRTGERSSSSVAHAQPLSDVAVLQSMPQEMRVRLYEQWRTARARYTAPTAMPLPNTAQKARNKCLPIMLGPLRKLMRSLGLRHWAFPYPIGGREFPRIYNTERLRTFQQEVVRALEATRTDPKKWKTIEPLLRAVTNYLCFEEPLEPDEIADVAFVPGYRSHFRAEAAGRLFQQGRVSKIYLSGHSPYYAKNEHEPLPLTEALAMAVYLIDLKPEFGISWNDLIIDPRPHCTLEHTLFSALTLRHLATQKNRPLTVLIVTSPYHLRRTWLIFKWFAINHPNVIGKIRCTMSETKQGLGKDEWFTNQAGIIAYMTEYWKIYGGRVTGEF